VTITDGLITLAEARASLGWSVSAVTGNDADLEAYIEAATPVIENITGPILERAETYTFDGGRPYVMLPVRFASVVSVTVDGVAVTDYVADLTAGIISVGTNGLVGWFASGVQNVVVVVNVGTAANESEVAPNVKLATRELVRFWWQQGRQANTPAFGDAPDVGTVPMGFAVPKRVMELLQSSPKLPGFA